MAITEGLRKAMQHGIESAEHGVDEARHAIGAAGRGLRRTFGLGVDEGHVSSHPEAEEGVAEGLHPSEAVSGTPLEDDLRAETRQKKPIVSVNGQDVKDRRAA